jgi:hypothetical protein
VCARARARVCIYIYVCVYIYIYIYIYISLVGLSVHVLRVKFKAAEGLVSDHFNIQHSSTGFSSGRELFAVYDTKYVFIHTVH